MDPKYFGRLLAHAPLLFGRLLARQRTPDTEDLRRAVLSFLEQLTPKDEFQLRRNTTLPAKRLARLARTTRLDSEFASLPLRIYQDYISGQHRTDRLDSPYSDEEIRFELARGGPTDPFAMIGDRPARWDAERKEFLFVIIEDGDPALHRGISEYLRSTSSCFESTDEARAEMVRRGLAT